MSTSLILQNKSSTDQMAGQESSQHVANIQNLKKLPIRSNFLLNSMQRRSQVLDLIGYATSLIFVIYILPIILKFSILSHLKLETHLYAPKILFGQVQLFDANLHHFV